MAELRRSGRLRNGDAAAAVVDVESEGEEREPRRSSSGRMVKAASAEEEDAVVLRLGLVQLSEGKQAKIVTLQGVVDPARAGYVQGKSKAEELKVSEIAMRVEEDAMEDLVDLESGSSDDDDLTDVQEEQEVLDRSLTNEGAALLAQVEKVLAEGGDLSKLRVDHLKAYLRHHGLRIGGVKAVLLSRIEDHLRLLGGQGELLYPRSSFRINCRGDVCFGDIVLFRHTVYDNDNFKRHGRPLGDRWVAGRIVNESYGAQKQQHTFTPWNNEEDRRKALEEKHARGAEARAQRQRRIETGSSSRGPSKPRPRPISNNQAGAVRPPHHTDSTQQPREQARLESGRNVRHGRDPVTRPVSMARDHAWVEVVEPDRDIVRRRENHHLSTRPVTMGRDQTRGEPDRNVLPVMRHEGFVPRGCSTQGCERAGASKCIVRSCGPCCYKFTLPRGSCPRHL